MAAAQDGIRFEDVAVVFSAEEWMHLDEAQRDLYKQVMLDNYQLLVSACEPTVISRIQGGQEPWVAAACPGAENRLPHTRPGHTQPAAARTSSHPVKSKLRVKVIKWIIAADPAASTLRPHSRDLSACGKMKDPGPPEPSDRIHTEEPRGPVAADEERITPPGGGSETTSLSHPEAIRKSQPPVSGPKKAPHARRHPVRMTPPVSCPSSLSTSSFPKHGGDYTGNKGKMSVRSASRGKRSKSSTLNGASEQPAPLSFYKAKHFTKQLRRLRKVVRVPEECRHCKKRFSVLVNPRNARAKTPPKTCSECKLRRSAGDRETFPCGDCGKRFLQASVLHLHLRSHSEEKLLVCPTCGKRFVQQTLLVIHQGTHKHNKPFQCMECANVFYSRTLFLHHQRSHKEEKPHGCSDCGKCFADNATLLIHQRTHTGEKPFHCSHCGKSFSQHSTLVSHQRIHTGEKPYECLQCGKRFSDRSALASHHRTHTGDRPFRCQACGKQFAQSSNLRRHERLHTGRKPHACSKCGKTFNEHTKLKYHEKVHLKRESKANSK